MDWKRELQTEDPRQMAARLMDRGFNCAEAVFIALKPNEEAKHPLATCFGAGLAREGSMCGALSGCAMAIGLEVNRIMPEDQEAKERAYVRMDAILASFRNRFGAVDCRTLTGLDMRKPEDRTTHEQEQRARCREFAQFVVGQCLAEKA